MAYKLLNTEHVLEETIKSAEAYELNLQELGYETGSASAEEHLERTLVAYEVASNAELKDLRRQASIVAMLIGSRIGKFNDVVDRVARVQTKQTKQVA